MKRFVLGAAMAVAMVSASAAQAVVYIKTQVQNLTFASAAPGTNTQQLLRFNPVNGRVLTAVSIRFFADPAALANTVKIDNGSGNTRNVTANYSMTNALTSSAFNLSTAFTSNSITYLLVKSSPITTYDLSFSGGQATLNPANVTPFVGSGSIAILDTFSAVVQSSAVYQGGKGNTTITGSTGTSRLEVIYTYTDPAPEPGTWVTMVLGFGLIGAAMRKRQASIAA